LDSELMPESKSESVVYLKQKLKCFQGSVFSMLLYSSSLLSLSVCLLCCCCHCRLRLLIIRDRETRKRYSLKLRLLLSIVIHSVSSSTRQFVSQLKNNSNKTKKRKELAATPRAWTSNRLIAIVTLLQRVL